MAQNACDARYSDSETVGSSAEMIIEVVGAEPLSSLSPEPTVTVLSAAGRTCLAAWLAYGWQEFKGLAEPVQSGSGWWLTKGQERFTLDPSGASGSLTAFDNAVRLEGIDQQEPGYG